MSKTSSYQKKASENYTAKKIKEGYVRINRWIRPEWLRHINELLVKLKKEENDTPTNPNIEKLEGHIKIFEKRLELLNKSYAIRPSSEKEGFIRETRADLSLRKYLLHNLVKERDKWMKDL